MCVYVCVCVCVCVCIGAFGACYRPTLSLKITTRTYLTS